MASVFSVEKQVGGSLSLRETGMNPYLQLVFYGAYHTNKTNIAIHIVCVPLLIWCLLFIPSGHSFETNRIPCSHRTAQAIVASLPKPSFFPDLYYEITPYLAFDFHFPFLVCVVGYLSYYFALLPSAAVRSCNSQPFLTN